MRFELSVVMRCRLSVIAHNTQIYVIMRWLLKKDYIDNQLDREILFVLSLGQSDL